MLFLKMERKPDVVPGRGARCLLLGAGCCVLNFSVGVAAPGAFETTLFLEGSAASSSWRPLRSKLLPGDKGKSTEFANIEVDQSLTDAQGDTLKKRKKKKKRKLSNWLINARPSTWPLPLRIKLRGGKVPLTGTTDIHIIGLLKRFQKKALKKRGKDGRLEINKNGVHKRNRKRSVVPAQQRHRTYKVRRRYPKQRKLRKNGKGGGFGDLAPLLINGLSGFAAKQRPLADWGANDRKAAHQMPPSEGQNFSPESSATTAHLVASSPAIDGELEQVTPQILQSLAPPKEAPSLQYPQTPKGSANPSLLLENQQSAAEDPSTVTTKHSKVPRPPPMLEELTNRPNIAESPTPINNKILIKHKKKPEPKLEPSFGEGNHEGQKLIHATSVTLYDKIDLPNLCSIRLSPDDTSLAELTLTNVSSQFDIKGADNARKVILATRFGKSLLEKSEDFTQNFSLMKPDDLDVFIASSPYSYFTSLPSFVKLAAFRDGEVTRLVGMLDLALYDDIQSAVKFWKEETLQLLQDPEKINGVVDKRFKDWLKYVAEFFPVEQMDSALSELPDKRASNKQVILALPRFFSPDSAEDDWPSSAQVELTPINHWLMLVFYINNQVKNRIETGAELLGGF